MKGIILLLHGDLFVSTVFQKKKWTQEGKDAFAVMAGDKPMLMSVSQKLFQKI